MTVEQGGMGMEMKDSNAVLGAAQRPPLSLDAVKTGRTGQTTKTRKIWKTTKMAQAQ